MTWKDLLSSPTYTGGALFVAGTALTGTAVADSLPKWVLVTGTVITALGGALAHWGAADNKDLPKPPPTP